MLVFAAASSSNLFRRMLLHWSPKPSDKPSDCAFYDLHPLPTCSPTGPIDPRCAAPLPPPPPPPSPAWATAPAAAPPLLPPRLSSRGSVYCGGAAAFPPFLVYCRLPCSAPSTDRMIDPFLFTGLGRGIGPVKQGNTEARQHGCNESLRTNIIQTDSVCERSCVSDRSKLKRQTPQHTYIQGTHILEYDPKLRVNTREQ